MNYKNTRRSRGTILILVVAVLGLLVVMGTAFLASSRSDTNAARMMNDAVNMDLATRSVTAEVQNTIFESTINPGDAKVLTGAWIGGRTYAIGNHVVSPVNGRVYECSAVTTAVPPGVGWTEVSAANMFAARLIDYPDRPALIANFGKSLLSYGYKDQPWLARGTSIPDPQIGMTDSSGAAYDDSDITFLRADRFQPSSGTMTNFYASDAAAQVSAIGNGTNDSVWNMLPFSSAGGVRYRYAVRIVDTNRMANLNVGHINSATPDVLARAGSYIPATWLNSPSIFNAADETAGALNNLQYIVPASANGLRGRSLFTGIALADWHTRMLAFERLGANPAAGLNAPQLEPFDLTDEVELRAYGLRGNNYYARPAAPHTPNMWKNTLGAGIAQREYYTTYSFDRPAFQTDPTGIAAPRTITGIPSAFPVDANGDRRPINLTQSSAPGLSSDDFVVRNALYLINAMLLSGYSQDEAYSLAINYIAQTSPARRGSWIGPGGIYLCALGTPSAHATASAPRVLVPAPTTYYFAYSAQPFINETTIYYKDATDGITEFAVELRNPYPVAINLEGWKIAVNGAVWHTFASGTQIRANSYLVLFSNPKTSLALASTPDPNTVQVTGAAIPADVRTGVVPVTLTRPYYDDTTPTSNELQVTVDRQNSPDPTTLTTDATSGSVLRGNMTAGRTPTAAAGADDPWMCSSNAAAAAGNHSLGKANSELGDAQRYGLQLIDRYATGLAPAAAPYDAIVPGFDATIGSYGNLGELCQYLKVAHTTTDLVSFTTVSDKLATAVTVGPVFPQETKVYLDFLSDAKAQAFLNLVAMVDRTSDGYDQIGNGAADSADEVRLPGRINLNTASFNVLFSLFRSFTATDAEAGKYVAYVMAFRDRKAVVSNTYYTTSGDPDFSSTDMLTLFGRHKGIHSIGELLIPLSVADGVLQFSGPTVISTNHSSGRLNGLSTVIRYGSNPATLFGPVWHKLYASATVRSDTFVVYGYVEAVKRNPGFTGTFNDASWYVNGTAPRNPAAAGPLQLVESRRFVAIVDRSWSNQGHGAGAVLPKIVAYKELPR